MLLDKKQSPYKLFLVLSRDLAFVLFLMCATYPFLSYSVHVSLLCPLISIFSGKIGKSLCKSCNSLGYSISPLRKNLISLFSS